MSGDQGSSKGKDGSGTQPWRLLRQKMGEGDSYEFWKECGAFEGLWNVSGITEGAEWRGRNGFRQYGGLCTDAKAVPGIFVFSRTL